MILISALLMAAPPELGAVKWNRNFESAAEKARRTTKPLLVLFDEVPGCSTCVRYGRSTLSHPLLVEAAESLFVPVAIFNNRQGEDRKVLNRFKEPTWNNPVVRIMDPSGQDLAPRLANNYQPSALAARMVSSLENSGQTAPTYLRLLAAEGVTTVRVHLSMACFWSGEVCIGGHQDVLSTRTGWMGGEEVVEIELRETKAENAIADLARCGRTLFSDHARLAAAGTKAGLRVKASQAFRATPKDDLHTLKRTKLIELPLTQLQKTRLNSALGSKESYLHFLSPGQTALLGKLATEDTQLQGPRSTISALSLR